MCNFFTVNFSISRGIELGWKCSIVRCSIKCYETEISSQCASSRCLLPGEFQSFISLDDLSWIYKFHLYQQDSVHLASGSIDGQLKMYDVNSSTDSPIGSHDNAIKCVEYSSKINGLVTGSWDKVSKIWFRLKQKMQILTESESLSRL